MVSSVKTKFLNRGSGAVRIEAPKHIVPIFLQVGPDLVGRVESLIEDVLSKNSWVVFDKRYCDEATLMAGYSKIEHAIRRGYQGSYGIMPFYASILHPTALLPIMEQLERKNPLDSTLAAIGPLLRSAAAARTPVMIVGHKEFIHKDYHCLKGKVDQELAIINVQREKGNEIRYFDISDPKSAQAAAFKGKLEYMVALSRVRALN